MPILFVRSVILCKYDETIFELHAGLMQELKMNLKGKIKFAQQLSDETFSTNFIKILNIFVGRNMRT